MFNLILILVLSQGNGVSHTVTQVSRHHTYDNCTAVGQQVLDRLSTGNSATTLAVMCLETIQQNKPSSSVE